MSSLPTSKMKRRTRAVIMGGLLILAAALVVNLFIISVVDNAEYQERANQNHFGSITIAAHRGSIYDTNENILAQSATVFRIFLDPSEYAKNKEDFEKAEAKRKAASEKKGKTYTPEVADFETYFISEITSKLGITEEVLRKAMGKTNRYEILKTQVEKPLADAIKAFKSDNALSCLGIEEDTKRYYPYDTLAATVVGFTNSDGVGQYGIEAEYDEYLAGVDGRVISAKNANNEEMPYRYSKTYDPQDGNSIYMTLDMTLQHYLEKSLEATVSKFSVSQRACGIIMNAKTGAILAMATTPSFDLNSPYEIYDPVKSAQIEAIVDEEAYKEAYINARDTQWKNKAITEPYFPGSVFKVFTSAAGLEEKEIDFDSIFTCTGEYYPVQGIPPIHCWNRKGHGTQNFIEALTNSCNPAFMEIGRRLGAERFADYFKAFGLTERTGIDLPNEATSFYIKASAMGPVQLASSSFGQSSKLTPIQMITGYAATINGGNLLTPYIVSKIVDSDGNVVKQNNTVIKRQVISEETSAKMRTALEAVVNNNGGSNAYIKGYRIGGKSGTSEKQDIDGEHYVASYCSFAPADDPEIILLIMADDPDISTGDYYGSTVAVPVAREVLAEALPYLGYYPEYTDEEIAELEVTVPSLEDKAIDNATATINELGLEYDIVGNGAKVVAQVPAGNNSMPRGGRVVLYTESDYQSLEEYNTTVPNVIEMNLAQANQTLSEMGLNYIATGASTEREDALVSVQSYEEGAQVPRGTIVELTFAIHDQSG